MIIGKEEKRILTSDTTSDSKDEEDETDVLDEDSESGNGEEDIRDEYGYIEPVFSLDTVEDIGLDMY